MATQAQSDGFVPARPEDMQASGSSDGFVAARPEDSDDGFTPARPQDIQDTGGPSVVSQGLDIINRPMAGYIKGLERTAGTFLDQAGQQFLGVEPGQPETVSSSLARSSNPAATATQLLPEGIKAPVRKALNKGSAWLNKNTDPDGVFEWGGNLGEMITEIMLMNEGAGTRAAQAGKAASKSSVGREVMGEVGSYAESLMQKAKHAKLLEDNPTIARLVDAGLKYARSAAQGATTGGIEGGAQTMAKTDDPEKAAEGGVVNAAIGAVAEPVAEAASEYLHGLKTGRIKPKATGPQPIPDRPVKAPPFPDPEAPPPPSVETPERMARPAAVEEVRQPTKPTIAPPDPLTERPEMPEPPPPIGQPPRILAKDQGPAPQPPEPFAPDRAPGEERFAQIEGETARGTVEDKLGTEEFIGDPDEAAQHILNLDRSIDSPEFHAMPEEHQAEMLRTRKELLQRADPDGTPQEIIDQVGDMGSAADAMEAKAKEAYNEWGDASGGKFTSLNNQLSKLRGKFDAESLEKKAEVEAELDELAKSGTIGSNIHRALYRSRFSDAFVLRDADDAFTKSWKGAERTGNLDPQALQRNWKNFVMKRGAERVRSVIGDERFESMNNFVNEFAGEKAADKAAQAAIELEHRQNMTVYTQRVKEAKTIAEAKQAALDAKHNADVLAQNTAHERAKAEVRSGIRQARVQDRLNTRRRMQEHIENVAGWADEVAKVSDLNAAKKIARDADLRAYRENVQARRHAQTQRTNIREAGQDAHRAAKDEVARKNATLTQEHGETLADWRQNAARIEESNRQQKSYKNLATGVWTYLKDNALPIYVAGQAAHVAGLPVDKAATVAGALWVTKRIATNPTALKIVSTAAATGARPEVYIPIIAHLISSSGEKKKEPTQ